MQLIIISTNPEQNQHAWGSDVAAAYSRQGTINAFIFRPSTGAKYPIFSWDDSEADQGYVTFYYIYKSGSNMAIGTYTYSESEQEATFNTISI